MKYDIIIPVSTKDALFIHRPIKYIIENLTPQNIYIITNKKNIKLLSEIKKHSICKILDEDKLIDGLSYNNLQNILKIKGISLSTTGWYLQQFLKMAFAQTSYANEYYLSWDADTIPLSKISFFKEERPLFTLKKEYHKPYFKTINKLLNINKAENYSFIAEHMLFNKKIMNELISDINNSSVKGNNWFEKIINAIDIADGYNSFSEFETYGNYCCHKYPLFYNTQQLNSFREGGLIAGRLISNKNLNLMSFDIDTISFELRHYPSFPLNIIHYIYINIIKLISKIV